MQKRLRVTGASALVLSVGLVLGVGFATPAPAVTIEWSGTFKVVIGDGGSPKRPPYRTGTGVSTVTVSGGVGDIVSFAHLNSFRLDGGITLTGTAPLTDPENSTLVTLMIDKTVAGRVGIPLGKGTLAPISGGGPLTDNQLTGVANPQPVRFKQCILVPGCSNYLPIPVSVNGLTGAGLGGLITINTFTKGGGLRLSIEGTPWTLGAAVISGIPNRITITGGGAVVDSFFNAAGPCGVDNAGGCTRFTVFRTETQSGFVHGPASNTTTTALLSGVIQFVTPTEVSTSLAPPNNLLQVFSTITIHFIPEPGLVLLLGSGVAGLVLLGRHRMRK